MFKQLIHGAICVSFLLATSSAAQELVPMTNEKMGEQLREEFGDDRVEGQNGAWRIVLKEDDETDEDELGRGLEVPDDADPTDAPPAAEELGGDEPGNADDNDAEGLPGSGAEGRLPAVMIVLTDNRANRMRLMMPIRELDPSRTKDLRLGLIALQCNYDRALDARYALQDGVLWSVFIHPLESLTADDLKNAIDQVRTLRKNTGTTFTSTNMRFGAAPPQKEEKEQDLESKDMDF